MTRTDIELEELREQAESAKKVAEELLNVFVDLYTGRASATERLWTVYEAGALIADWKGRKASAEELLGRMAVHGKEVSGVMAEDTKPEGGAGWQVVYEELQKERLKNSQLRQALLIAAQGLMRTTGLLERMGATAALMSELKNITRRMMTTVTSGE